MFTKVTRRMMARPGVFLGGGVRPPDDAPAAALPGRATACPGAN